MTNIVARQHLLLATRVIRCFLGKGITHPMAYLEGYDKGTYAPSTLLRKGFKIYGTTAFGTQAITHHKSHPTLLSTYLAPMPGYTCPERPFQHIFPKLFSPNIHRNKGLSMVRVSSKNNMPKFPTL